jgi:hypothetical protein
MRRSRLISALRARAVFDSRADRTREQSAAGFAHLQLEQSCVSRYELALLIATAKRDLTRYFLLGLAPTFPHFSVLFVRLFRTNPVEIPDTQQVEPDMRLSFSTLRTNNCDFTLLCLELLL